MVYSTQKTFSIPFFEMKKGLPEHREGENKPHAIHNDKYTPMGTKKSLYGFIDGIDYVDYDGQKKGDLCAHF